MSSNNNSTSIDPLVIVVGSSTFIVGLAWNDAIQGVINSYYPFGDKKDTIRAKLIYALVVTIFVIIFVYFINITTRVVTREVSKTKAYQDVKKFETTHDIAATETSPPDVTTGSSLPASLVNPSERLIPRRF